MKSEPSPSMQMQRLDVKRITIKYGDFSGDVCYEASTSDYPSLKEYDDTFMGAFNLLIESIEETLKSKI